MAWPSTTTSRAKDKENEAVVALIRVHRTTLRRNYCFMAQKKGREDEWQDDLLKPTQDRTQRRRLAAEA